ncbi:MAG: hypothetical protein JWP97_3645 [Labilithrix sp.]|nr:hypothetical protein [Labilithrix sp.]
MTNYLLPIVTMLAVGGYWFYVQSKTKKAMAGMGPAMHDYFTKSGFRYPDMAPEPVEAHTQRAIAEMQAPPTPGEKIVQYVRNFHGVAILFKQAYTRTENGNAISVSWSTPLRQPPRVPFQVADRSLSSVGKAVREAFSNMTRNWSARFPHQVQTGNPQFDARFVVYGHDPNAVAMLLQQNPALCAQLLQCVEVDFYVDAQACVFSDPLQKNMNAAMGGMVGQMAMGFDYAKRMELTIPVHDRVCEIIAMAVRASQ